MDLHAQLILRDRDNSGACARHRGPNPDQRGDAALLLNLLDITKGAEDALQPLRTRTDLVQLVAAL